jgi:hypothetical protein
MRKALVVTTLAGVLAAVAFGGSAAQATSVSFSLTGSTLSISEPTATATLSAGTLSVGSTVSGSLGSTTVSDQRGGILAASWKVQVTGSAFSNGTTTIPVGAAVMYVDTPITVSGLAVPTTLYLTALTGLPLTLTAQDFITTLPVLGTTSATYNPKVQVTIPAGATAGTYTGTITQTVL